LDNKHASQTNATINNLITNSKNKKKGEGRNKKTYFCEERRKNILTNLLGIRITLQILHLLLSH
jgi:hypothetical protein